MNQIKIGKFIAACRKEQKLTQAQLAERLGITDRAVSKWETGKSLPDASVMLELCTILNINVNELLSGERIMMESYNRKAEENLLEMKKQKEAADKRLLTMEWVIGGISIVFFFAMIGVGAYLMKQESPQWMFWLLFGIGIVQFLIAMSFALRIEQKAGYYECQKCHHRYVPNFSSVFFAMHVNRTRYMKCPKCGQKSWQKKVIGQNETEG